MRFFFVAMRSNDSRRRSVADSLIKHYISDLKTLLSSNILDIFLCKRSISTDDLDIFLNLNFQR